MRDGQSTIDFKLYRLDSRLPPLDATHPRTFVLTEAAASAARTRVWGSSSSSSNHVPETAVAARLSVAVGGGAMAATRATVKVFFGSTEIRAEAASAATGDSKTVQIHWA